MSLINKGKGKQSDNDIYTRILFTKKVVMNMLNIGGNNIKTILEKMVARQLEGKCIVEGYIKPGSTRLMTYSSGIINGDMISFEAAIECLICSPVEGMRVECVVKNITKAGIRAEVEVDEEKGGSTTPMVIFIIKEHHMLIGDLAIKNLFLNAKENDRIAVKVIGQRYEINDKYISVIAELVKMGRPPSTATAAAEPVKSAPTSTVQTKAVLKYCCPDEKDINKCAKIESALKNTVDKYAIMTLIFGGDSYLPGVLLLGTTIRAMLKTTPYKNIELCCMVTEDVSASAKELIKKVYDQIIPVDYIQVDPKLIRHNIPAIRAIYAKTFTKLRIFEFSQFRKVLFLDADMLVLKPDIFGLFNLDTPAAIFMGHLTADPRDRYFKEFTENGRLFKQFQQKYCRADTGKDLHGSKIPYTKGDDDEEMSNGMNIETSILLIEPLPDLVRMRNAFLNTLSKPIHGDTEMISRMFKENIIAIDPRFFGRWVNPYEHPELVVLDLYGTQGKPWDNEKLNVLAKYAYVGDVTYWWKTYISVYETDYKSYGNPRLDLLYKNIKSNALILNAMAKK